MEGHFQRQISLCSARPAQAERAFSLLELLAVLTVMGLLTSLAFLRFGTTTFATTTADGFSRTLVLDLRQAQRRTISTGDNHHLQFHRTDGMVTGYTLYRGQPGGDVPVDRTIAVPEQVTVTTGTDRVEFDFDGSLGSQTGVSSITVHGPHATWTITLHLATGLATIEKAFQPQ